MRVLLLPLVQGAIVSLSTKGSVIEPPYEIDWVDPSTGQLTKIVDLGTDGYFSGGGSRNDNTAVYTIESNTADAYLTTVDLSTGKIQVGQPFPRTFFLDLQLDKVTNQTFAFGNSANATGFFEVLPHQTLQQITKVPPGVYGAGAYSSSKHIYFLRTGVSRLLAVGTVGQQKGTILYNVSVGLGQVGNLVYDDTFGVLYVWGATDTKTILAALDYTTGKILKTLFTSPTTAYRFGPTCIDKAATTVYTSLFDEDTNRSMIHSVDLASGKASQVPTTRDAKTMNCL